MSSNLVLDGHPQRSFDLLMPSVQPERSVIFLHGGGGSKEGVAAALGLDGLSQDELNETGVAWVLPQGESIANGVPTWSNYVMDSGADDVTFLVDLAQWLRTNVVTDFIVLAGHSNGGMMAHRMWCEEGQEFSLFLSVAGPPTILFHPGSDAPLACDGSEPYWAIIGERDRVIQTQGQLDADQWTVSPALVAQSGDSFLNPDLMNEIQAHKELRAPLVCPGEDAADPVESGQRSVWTSCDDKVRLWLIGHPLGSGALGLLGQHPISVLEDDGDFLVRDLVAEWD